MNKLPQDTIQCNRCGVFAPKPGIHILPKGWERHMGNDYCRDCMKLLTKFLKRLSATREASNASSSK